MSAGGTRSSGPGGTIAVTGGRKGCAEKIRQRKEERELRMVARLEQSEQKFIEEHVKLLDCDVPAVRLGAIREAYDRLYCLPHQSTNTYLDVTAETVASGKGFTFEELGTLLSEWGVDKLSSDQTGSES